VWEEGYGRTVLASFYLAAFHFHVFVLDTFLQEVTNLRGLRAIIVFGYMMSPKLMKVRMSVLHPQHNLKAVKYLHV
jgi:hypothetical protein